MTDMTWFKPLPAQEQFIRDDSTEVIYGGGVGSGKTISGGFKVLRAALKWPGTSILIGRQTYRALEDTTMKVLMDGDDKPPVIPPELVAQTINKENRYVLHNGTELLFRSLESHNIEKLLSLNLGAVYVDECTETSESVWLALLGRLRHPIGPRNAWGTTNPNGHDWVWRNFHPDGPNLVEGRVMYLQPTEANPYLPPDYIASLRRRPKEWQKRFVDASFDTAAGAIWDQWDRNIHVIETHLVSDMPVRWYRGRGLDHGRRNPTAVLWFMVDNDGFIIISDEHYQEGMLPSQHAPIIRAKDEMLAPGIKLGSVIAPPDCFRADHNGHTVADEYRDAAGLELTLADDNVDAGLLRVAEWMLRDEELPFPEWHPWAGTLGPDGKGSPRMFVADRCTNLISEIPDYRWVDLSPSQEEVKDKPEEPRKIRDHACFPPGTRIATDRGECAIEDVRIGDLVWTRGGLRPVTDAALTDPDAECWRVTFTDGSSLTATPDHPLWVKGRGFVRLDALRYSDECLRIVHASVSLTEKRGTSGKTPTDPSQTDGTFTTSTVGGGITDSRIWSQCQPQRIFVSMGSCQPRHASRLSTALGMRLLNGTARKRVARGTASTPSDYGRTNPSTTGTAISAAPSTKPLSLAEASSVPMPASRHGGAILESTTRFADVSSAKNRSGWESTSTIAPALASVRVSSVARLGAEKRSAVYGLTVADDHEFFADGVLVSNCDALRYVLMSRPRPFSAPNRAASDERPRPEASLTHNLMSKQF